MNPSGSRFLFDLPGQYCIRVQGLLSPNLAYRFSGMTITAEEPASQEPVMTLTGELRDQAALMGILNTLYDLQYPLLAVERLRGSPTAEDPKRRGETT
jgi:hypothetical protein